MSKNSRIIWLVILITAFAGWQFYQTSQRASGIDRAEFRVLYSDLRQKLDSYSKCQSPLQIQISGKTRDEQIDLQRKFRELRNKVSDGRFAPDQLAVDLEIQVRDRNPVSRMEDDKVRCARLASLGVIKKDDVAGAYDRLDTFLKDY